MTKEHQSEQLSLLGVRDVPLRFRLDEATVRRGRRHIAEIRIMLRQQHGDERDAPAALPRRRRAA